MWKWRDSGRFLDICQTHLHPQKNPKPIKKPSYLSITQKNYICTKIFERLDTVICKLKIIVIIKIYEKN